MNAIILFSHGSLLCGSGVALNEHAARLREQNIAPIVEVGYLNYSEPLFADAVATCVAQGATRIQIVPFFLIPGKFVKLDLPKVVAEARLAFPEIVFVVAEAIGFDERLVDSLVECSQRTSLPLLVCEAGFQNATAFCRDNPECPLNSLPLCPHHRPEIPVPVSPEFAPLPETDALLIMVHGSPRPIANEAMFEVVAALKNRHAYRVVEVGFMECNTPTIPEAIDACAVQGATRLVAVPYFLHTGTHVADDLPGLLVEGQERHPDLIIRMGDYLGRSHTLTAILADRVRALTD